jgi:hypothetical protein
VNQRLELLAETIERIAVPTDLIGGTDELIGFETQAQVARRRVPGLVSAVDVERAIEQLLNARCQTRDRFRVRQAAYRRAQGTGAGRNLVPVGQLKQRERSHDGKRERAETDRESCNR